ncbi:MAG: urease subunit gamma [Candidatus Bathyarchaeia archaeon]
MRLTPKEVERLIVFSAAELARKRKARGLKLNHPESVALICDEICEMARDGKSVADCMDNGAKVLKKSEVMSGVPQLLNLVQVECLFPDGTKLVSIHDPIRE